ncbi:MAG TPA: MerR family transcriptional regulator [Trebonia sp.]|nr:MerR family transcriptional regulator [Trebonia sp.]
MRITEAAARLGMSPRMLRYREELGLLPPLRDRPYGRGHAHRQFTEEDLEAITTALAIERRFDITPAALAFGLRVLTDPAARAAVADLGRRTGHVPAGPGAGRALDFEKERALRALAGGYPPRPAPDSRHDLESIEGAPAVRGPDRRLLRPARLAVSGGGRGTSKPFWGTGS